MSQITPLMKQYNSIKTKYPNCVILFMVGNFYESFGSCAETIAEVTGLTLVNRIDPETSLEHKLCGFPLNSLDRYLKELCKEGRRVAVCGEFEEVEKNSKLVKRN